MKNELTKRTKEWMQLERKTLEQRKIAETYYEEQLMGLITENYVDRNKSVVIGNVEYLVVSVGTSYEPIVLNIKLLSPTKILFLYTKQWILILLKKYYCSLKMILRVLRPIWNEQKMRQLRY